MAAGAREIKAGGAFVDIRVRDRVRRGLVAIQARLRAMSGFVSRLSRSFALLGTGITVAMIGAAKSFADAGDKIHKMSGRTGVSAEALSKLGFAAEQSGSSLDGVGNAVFRMRRRVANAARDMGPAVKALQALGFDAKELAALAPEEMFLRIADALKQVPNESTRAQLAFEIFGLQAKDLFVLLDEGRDGIERLMDEAGRLGKVFTEDGAQAAADFTDAMNRVKTAIAGIVIGVGQAFAPWLTRISNNFSDGAASASQWVRKNREVVLLAASAPAILFAMSAALKAVGVAATLTATLVGAVSTAITIATGVISFAIGLIGSLTTVVGVLQLALVGIVGVIGFFVVKAGAAAIAATDFGKAVNVLGMTFKTAWQGIRDAIAAGDLELALKIAGKALEIAWVVIVSKLEEIWNNFLIAIARRTEDLLPKAALKLLGRSGVANILAGTERARQQGVDSQVKLLVRELKELAGAARQARTQLEGRQGAGAARGAAGRIGARVRDLAREEAGAARGAGLFDAIGRAALIGARDQLLKSIGEVGRTVAQQAAGGFGTMRPGRSFAFGGVMEKDFDEQKKHTKLLERIEKVLTKGLPQFV